MRLLSASMEIILLYCSDHNSTVRLNANESLNRIIVVCWTTVCCLK